jgi:hypothetical protein
LRAVLVLWSFNSSAPAGALNGFEQTTAASETHSETASRRFTTLADNVKANIMPELHAALREPSGKNRDAFVEHATEAIAKLCALPSPPQLHWVESSERFGLMSYLELGLARTAGERIANRQTNIGADENQFRRLHAQKALEDIGMATSHLIKAKAAPPSEVPDLLASLIANDWPGFLLHMEANAHAILWVGGAGADHRRMATNLWQQASQTPYAVKFKTPTPELLSALTPDLAEPRSLVPLWVGASLMALVTIAAFFHKRPTSFQYYVYRLVAALGAGGIGAVLPGTLHVRFTGADAGGALALFLLVYRVNPAALVHDMAGNLKSTAKKP